jgi:glycosyltransferase involved in cell wall biosynthesis
VERGREGRNFRSDKDMRIAVWHNLPSGGGKRALFDQVRGLTQRGHTIKSWCPSTSDQTYLPLSQLIEERILPFRFEARMGKTRVSEIIKPYREVVEKLDEMDRHCRQCADEINSGDFDLLFANTCFFFHVSCIGRFVNIPKVIYLNEPCRHLYEARPQEPFRYLSGDGEPQLHWIALPKPRTPKLIRTLKRFPRDFMELQACRLQAREEWLGAKAFDRILVNSFFSRETVVRTYGMDARVCYLGIDTNGFVNRHLPRENFVVGLGAIAEHKNATFIVESLAQVSTPRPKLLWIGNGANPEYFQKVIQFADDLGVDLETKVRVSDEELVDLLNRALMMLYAPRLEPFGLAPLEANACGVPVIAVAEGGVRETVIHRVNGLLVDSNPRAMATAIEYLMSDPRYARKLGETGARLVAERWSLDAGIHRLERELLDIVTRQTGPERGNASSRFYFPEVTPSV